MHCILVTDDNTEYRKGVIELLQFQGYMVIEAENGSEAVRQAQTQKPDLILCDIDMPIMDGFAVLAAVKADPATAHIPFFLVTGHTDAQSIQRGDALGADDYMIKPMDVDLLLAKLEQYLAE